MQLHVYDVIMLTIVAIGVIWGAWKGIAWQIASLASVVVSFVMAVRFSPQLAPVLSPTEPWNRYLAMLVIFLGVSLLIWLIYGRVSSAIAHVKLSDFDRQLGAMFGALKGVLVCLVITYFMVSMSDAGRQTVLESRSGYVAAWILDRASPLLPEGLHSRLEPYIDSLDEALPDAERQHRQHNFADGFRQPAGPSDGRSDGLLPIPDVTGLVRPNGSGGSTGLTGGNSTGSGFVPRWPAPAAEGRQPEAPAAPFGGFEPRVRVGNLEFSIAPPTPTNSGASRSGLGESRQPESDGRPRVRVNFDPNPAPPPPDRGTRRPANGGFGFDSELSP